VHTVHVAVESFAEDDAFVSDDAPFDEDDASFADFCFSDSPELFE
jgi:hypothetical protein